MPPPSNWQLARDAAELFGGEWIALPFAFGLMLPVLLVLTVPLAAGGAVGYWVGGPIGVYVGGIGAAVLFVAAVAWREERRPTPAPGPTAPAPAGKKRRYEPPPGA